MIDYKLINESIEYYEKLNFKRIESPWTVSEYINRLTKPEDINELFQLKHNDKCLVASGEQSFLYLYLKNFLPKGQFQTVTPCFRMESFDSTHSKYFIKNELIKTDVVNQPELEIIVNKAVEFFEIYFDKKNINISQTKEGFDININNIEIASYGIRSCDFLTWIYGTACAEPRTSNLIQKYGLSFK